MLFCISFNQILLYDVKRTRMCKSSLSWTIFFLSFFFFFASSLFRMRTMTHLQTNVCCWSTFVSLFSLICCCSTFVSLFYLICVFFCKRQSLSHPYFPQLIDLRSFQNKWGQKTNRQTDEQTNAAVNKGECCCDQYLHYFCYLAC